MPDQCSYRVDFAKLGRTFPALILDGMRIAAPKSSQTHTRRIALTWDDFDGDG